MRTKRLYNADKIAAGVQTVHKLQQHVMKVAPMSAGPLAALNPAVAPTSAEPTAELIEAHCHGCGEKKTFQVENTDTMKNGALRKSGKGVCGHRLSTFVSGSQDGQ